MSVEQSSSGFIESRSVPERLAKTSRAMGDEAVGRTLLSSPSDISWMTEGSCRAPDLSTDLFFPSDGESVKEAQQICAGCPVKKPCLEYALVNHINQGVWGGESERGRRRLAKSRRRRLT
ncbi:MAG: WhiB family transcriptional regulator [Candidatus Saccharimonadales bacterium]